MSNGFVVVDEKDWSGASEERRALMTYKTLKSIDDRLKLLEKRPLTDKCWSFAGGIIGGFLAAIGVKLGS